MLRLPYDAKSVEVVLDIIVDALDVVGVVDVLARDVVELDVGVDVLDIGVVELVIDAVVVVDATHAPIGGDLGPLRVKLSLLGIPK